MFELNQQCVIQHYNGGRGKNDESPAMLHIKLSCDAISPEAAAAALRARGPGEVQQAFFSDDKPRFPGASEFPISQEYEAKHQITFEDQEQLRVSKLFKIVLTALVSGSFYAEFTVSVESPSAEFLYYIANHQHKSVHIDLVQDVRELELNKEDKPAEKAKRPGRVRKIEGEQAALIN